MKKWISLLMVALILLAAAPFSMAEPEITQDSIVIIVNCKNSATIREKATSDSKKLGEAKRGTTYKLLAVDGNWYKIQYTKSKTGFVFHKYAQVGKKSDVPTGKIAIVTNAPNGVNIRLKPNGKILGEAHNGDIFEVKGKKNNWTMVAYNGGIAYIFTAYLTLSGGSSSQTVTPVDNKKAYIDCNTKVVVRAKASSSSKRLGNLKRGDEITVTGTTAKWTRIKYKDGVAFVFSKYVSYTKPDEDIAGKTATIVNCKACVNVRAKASSNSKKLGTADKGSTWSILGRSGNWIKINYYGENAFIYRRYVKIG